MTKDKYIEKLLKYPSAWVGHAKFAMWLVETFRPRVIVDLGVDYGFSTFCFAYPQIGKVYGVDWFQGDEHAGDRNTLDLVTDLYTELDNEFNIKNVELIKGDFQKVARDWERFINILHIDGFHSYEAVSLDYKTWSKFCTKDSIILFHDVESHYDTVGKFFDELKGYKLINTGSAGLGIYTESEEVFNKIKSILNV